MKYLVTGTAGFIGYHLAQRLLRQGRTVVGLDGMTDYYDVRLKRRRHANLLQNPGFTAHEMRLEDGPRLGALIADERPDVVVHLAAQAGVRYSIEHPRAYIDANIEGTYTLLEAARAHATPHVLIASTSSVYGANAEIPFVETARTDHPLTLYAATKKATEDIAHSYAHLFGIPTTVLRFFTVYGPWGRPDMALFKFTRAIVEGEPIEVYNHGAMERDFTYVDDIVEAVDRLSVLPPPVLAGPEAAAELDLSSPVAPYRVVNIGNGEPVRLTAFVEAVEAAVGRPARRTLLPMQPGDVPRTWADTTFLRRLTGFAPSTPVAVGVPAFVRWYQEYYGA